MLEIGEIMAFAGSAAPKGFLVCDGSAVSRTTYAVLFAAIGTTYGSGDGSTTFNVPNLKGRVAIGYNSSETEFDAIGETGGANTINIQHSHTQTDHTHSVSGTTGAQSSNVYVDNGSNATFIARSDHTHTFSGTSGGASNLGTDNQLSATQSVLNPYISLNFVIRASVYHGGSFIFNIL